MIAQEFMEEGKPLPVGPEDWVDFEEISQEQPHIAVTVRIKTLRGMLEDQACWTEDDLQRLKLLR
jgi:hypothetical protein